MDAATERVVHDWLWLAQRDLAAARQLGGLAESLYEPAIYHCEQGAEKALKGFLAWRGIRPPKSHSIGFLLEACEAFEPGFARWRTVADALTRAGVEYRYPGEAAFAHAGADDLLEASSAATEIFAFVIGLLPPVVHPRNPPPEPGPLPPL